MTNDSTFSARPAPPVGEFQHLDGRDVFVHRSGSGGPAVVVLPGADAVGLDYLLVQQQASRFTTTVVYDRGGTGYSDPMSLPRSAADVAAELHGLLRAQGIAAPYVLVAHSQGGAYAHPFRAAVPAGGGRAGPVGRVPSGLGRLHAGGDQPDRGRMDGAGSGATAADAPRPARHVYRADGGLPGGGTEAAGRGPRE